MRIESHLLTALGPFRWERRLEARCTVPLATYRERMVKLGYSATGNLPPFFQPACEGADGGR